MTAKVAHGNDFCFPSWLPDATRHYLLHTADGTPIRVLARSAAVHPSTILRQVRQVEHRREDVLVDEGLSALSEQMGAFVKFPKGNNHDMHIAANTASTPPPPVSEFTLRENGLRVLRRMSEAGAYLAVGRDMDHGIIVRETPSAGFQRLGSVEASVAQAMALKNWVACMDKGAKVSRYRITTAGRAMLKELMAVQENAAQGFDAEFASSAAKDDPLSLRAFTSLAAESPLAGLSRRRDKQGKPFLSRELVAAGERLREDFELSEMTDRADNHWLMFLGDLPTSLRYPDSEDVSAQAARRRVEIALIELGPDMGQVLLRTCCFLEGMEALEKRMGWSARSGKIVLRIALRGLIRHYAEVNGGLAAKIG